MITNTALIKCPIFQPLAEQGRVLVGEGVLTKMCRKKPKARQFFLFNDILVYGNILMNKKKYNKQHVIPLEEVKLESLRDEGREYFFAHFKKNKFSKMCFNLYLHFMLLELRVSAWNLIVPITVLT